MTRSVDPDRRCREAQRFPALTEEQRSDMGLPPCAEAGGFHPTRGRSPADALPVVSTKGG